MKLNSHAKEITVNITLTFDDLQRLHEYVEHLTTFLNDGRFDPKVLANYSRQLRTIIEEVERNA